VLDLQEVDLALEPRDLRFELDAALLKGRVPLPEAARGDLSGQVEAESFSASSARRASSRRRDSRSSTLARSAQGLAELRADGHGGRHPACDLLAFPGGHAGHNRVEEAAGGGRGIDRLTERYEVRALRLKELGELQEAAAQATASPRSSVDAGPTSLLKVPIDVDDKVHLATSGKAANACNPAIGRKQQHRIVRPNLTGTEVNIACTWHCLIRSEKR